MTPGTNPWEGGLLPSTGALSPEKAGEPAVSVAGCQARRLGERTRRSMWGWGIINSFMALKALRG